MQVEIERDYDRTTPSGRGVPTWNFKITDRDGKPIWTGTGFISEASCRHALEVAKRSLAGMAPFRAPFLA